MRYHKTVDDLRTFVVNAVKNNDSESIIELIDDEVAIAYEYNRQMQVDDYEGRMFPPQKGMVS